MTTKKRLTRSNDKMIAGVLSGIANYFDMDPTIVRVIFVVLTIASFGIVGIIIYLVLWAVMPLEQTPQF